MMNINVWQSKYIYTFYIMFVKNIFVYFFFDTQGCKQSANLLSHAHAVDQKCDHKCEVGDKYADNRNLSGPLSRRCFPVVSTTLLDERFSSAECSWGQALGGGAREVSPLFGGLFAN